MPSIDLHRAHHLDMVEARQVIDRMAARMHDKYGTRGDWRGDTLHFSRTGLKGTIALTADAVRVHAELGVMLSPLRATIEQEIRRKLDELFP